MNSIRCDCCKHFEPIDNPKVVGAKGWCHCHPPQFVALPTPKGLQVLMSFPKVEAKTWCGEWKDNLQNQ